MAYPSIPPSTENTVVNKASLKALSGMASAMGANMISGGMGKNDDSAKLKAHKYFSACLCLAQNSV